MRYVEAEGVRLSVVGLGAWQFGSREWGYGESYASNEAVAIVQRALDLGINLIDTAEVYAFGRSERIVGRAIAGRRDDAFVATKIFPIVPVAPLVERRALGSARRLGVSSIDLYQVHWPNPVVPLSSTMRGMRRVLETGLVKHAGVSNFSLAQWISAERALDGPVLSNQVRFSLVSRRPDHELVSFAQRVGRVVIAYSPLGQGLLSARYDAGNPPSGAVRRNNPLFLPENLERAAGLLRVLREVAAGHACTPAQVALAWLIAKPNVVVIPGASSVAQVEANAAAAEVVLTEGEIDALTSAAESFRPIEGPSAVGRMVRARVGR